MLEQIRVSARETTRALREGLLLRPLLGLGLGFFDAAGTRQSRKGYELGPAQVSSRFCILACAALVVQALRGETRLLTPGFLLGIMAGMMAEAVCDQASRFSL